MPPGNQLQKMMLFESFHSLFVEAAALWRSNTTQLDRRFRAMDPVILSGRKLSLKPCNEIPNSSDMNKNTKWKWPHGE